jgi:hypothetical protein
MPQEGVIVMDGCDKGDGLPELGFDVFQCFSGYFPKVQIAAGVFFDRVEVDHEFMKDRAAAGCVNHLVDL